MGDQFDSNSKPISVRKNLNCKSKNVIYVAQCTLCNNNVINEGNYVGQTSQAFHKRANGHRACFNINDDDICEKSALALHSKNEHESDFNMNNFKFVLYDQSSPRNLNRYESRLIGELRTNLNGLNRMNIHQL